MNHKIKYRILAISIATLLTAACNDFLAPEAPSSFDTDYVFASSGDAKKALLGAYALFCADDFTSRMSNVWMQNTDVEAMQGAATAATADRRTIWTLEGGLLENWGEMDDRWNNCYTTIDRCNQVIEGIAASSIKNEPDMKMYFAEAHVLRAYRYFMLCNFWGDVPYFREAAKAGMELDRPKTDKNIIYSGMIQDLVNLEGDIYYMDQFTDGVERMNREFAIGMIARLSLFRAGYGMTYEGVMKRADDYLNLSDEALAVTYTVNGQTKTARTSTEYFELAKVYCQKLIAERPKELKADFGKVFRDQCEQIVDSKNTEVLYEVAFGTGTTNSRGDVGWAIGIPVTNGASTKGTTTVQTCLSPVYYFSFDPKDVRRDVTCGLIQYETETLPKLSGPRELPIGKWNRLWMKNDQGVGSSKSTGINWPLMRYPDILLMLAEAENELNGPTDLAKNALKEVRMRAFAAADRAEKVHAYVDGLTSKQAFFDAVVNERAWEFGGECLRKWDLVRWNIYGKKIVQVKQTILNIGKAVRGLELGNPDVAKYAGMADMLFYKRNGNAIILLNLPEKKWDGDATGINTESSTVSDWVNDPEIIYRKNWALEFCKDATGAAPDYNVYSFRGYTDETGESAVPYLLPIGSRTRGASDVLNNDGYGHVRSN